jgi:hypothetical protein
VYSAVLGFFIPSGGGKWIIEAPYVMLVANDLQYHLGWAVQIYNAAEALPNLINPFYMLPLPGRAGPEGARPDRLLVRTAAGACAAGAGAAVGAGYDLAVRAARDAVRRG